MKLFVDDMRKCPEGWELARNNTEAIRLLATGHVEEISIDHDIVVPHLDDKYRRRLKIGDETFQPVVYYLCVMPTASRPKVIRIHTANYSAGVRMEGLLRDAGMGCDVAESEQEFEEID